MDDKLTTKTAKFISLEKLYVYGRLYICPTGAKQQCKPIVWNASLYACLVLLKFSLVNVVISREFVCTSFMSI